MQPEQTDPIMGVYDFVEAKGGKPVPGFRMYVAADSPREGSEIIVARLREIYCPQTGGLGIEDPVAGLEEGKNVKAHVTRDGERYGRVKLRWNEQGEEEVPTWEEELDSHVVQRYSMFNEGFRSGRKSMSMLESIACTRAFMGKRQDTLPFHNTLIDFVMAETGYRK